MKCSLRISRRSDEVDTARGLVSCAASNWIPPSVFLFDQYDDEVPTVATEASTK